jgi:hypothetical protein
MAEDGWWGKLVLPRAWLVRTARNGKPAYCVMTVGEGAYLLHQRALVHRHQSVVDWCPPPFLPFLMRCVAHCVAHCGAPSCFAMLLPSLQRNDECAILLTLYFMSYTSQEPGQRSLEADTALFTVFHPK